MLSIDALTSANHLAAFTAAFSLDTPPEFSVSPSAGVLPSSTSAAAVRGTGSSSSSAATAAALVVSFVPREYGMVYHGRLVVDTAVAQWAWRVEGRVREPQVPSGTAARVQSHLEARESAALAAAHTATRRAAEGGR